jgi:drug/metabolite transporter (DMT)-like permease
LDGGEFASGIRAAIIVVFAWTAVGCVIGYMAPAAGGLADRSVDPGILATVRTGVLAVVTLLIAWIGRHARFREWGWLVYPLLVGIGVKMMTEDFKHSRPATLFIAMALFGAALIVAPRLRRGGNKVTAQPGA